MKGNPYKRKSQWEISYKEKSLTKKYITNTNFLQDKFLQKEIPYKGKSFIRGHHFYQRKSIAQKHAPYRKPQT